MIYLNHAATTYPKPPGVPEAVAKALESAPQSQYRGVSAGEYGEDRIKLCRENLARLFQIGNPERIFFTSGSTQALNMAILGYRSPRKRIVYTAAEHNSVLRTIFDGLKEEIRAGRILPVEVGCDRGGYVDMEAMERAITGDTGLVIVNHSSNVTGAVQDIRQIGSWAREKGACFLADVSQSAGALPVDVEAMNIDMLAFTGHKGLYGIQGTGGLYVREGIPLRPLLFGGTGKDSRTLVAQEPFYEVGTMNMPGIAGLNAGVEYVLETGLEKIMAHERYMMRILFEGLRALPGVALCGDRQPGGHRVYPGRDIRYPGADRAALRAAAPPVPGNGERRDGAGEYLFYDKGRGSHGIGGGCGGIYCRHRKAWMSGCFPQGVPSEMLRRRLYR